MARRSLRSSRVVVALGGNAIAAGGRADAAAQQAAVAAAMEAVAELVVAGHEVAITHGNGLQVGSLLLKDELAGDVADPVPLDWCVAETQAMIGYLIVTALERSLARRGIGPPVITLITRVLVDVDDAGWRRPTKPVGPFLDEPVARERMRRGQTWGRSPDGRGWRRLVPSPEPREILDRDAVVRLLDDGAVVVAAGGGGIPMVRRNGGLEGAEAVLDKDLSAALLARAIRADCLVIATDVEAVALDFGRPTQRWLTHVTPETLARHAAEGHFAAGSMGPKVEAVRRFVAAGGARAVITSLANLRRGIEGRSGTVVEAAR